jgi:gas vesicle protein
MEDNRWVPSDGCGCEGWGGDANMTKGRALLGGLALLVLLAFAAGCGLVSDQAKQEAKKKLEAKGQQARQEATTRVEVKKQEVEAGQEDLKKQVDDLKMKVEAGQEDLKKEVDDLQMKLDDVQKKLDEVLKKLEAQEQPDQEEEEK